MQDPPHYTQYERTIQTTRTSPVSPISEDVQLSSVTGYEVQKKDIHVDIRTVPTLNEDDNSDRAYSADSY
jgi:hypothetical protein